MIHHELSDTGKQPDQSTGSRVQALSSLNDAVSSRLTVDRLLNPPKPDAQQ